MLLINESYEDDVKSAWMLLLLAKPLEKQKCTKIPSDVSNIKDTGEGSKAWDLMSYRIPVN